MPEPIPPALTADEWDELTVPGGRDVSDIEWLAGEDPYKIIAYANAMLDDTDPRKITWAMVDMLTDEGEMIGTGGLGRGEKPDEYYERPHRSMDEREADMVALAALLASYLPAR